MGIPNKPLSSRGWVEGGIGNFPVTRLPLCRGPPPTLSGPPFHCVRQWVELCLSSYYLKKLEVHRHIAVEHKPRFGGRLLHHPDTLPYTVGKSIFNTGHTATVPSHRSLSVWWGVGIQPPPLLVVPLHCFLWLSQSYPSIYTGQCELANAWSHGPPFPLTGGSLVGVHHLTIGRHGTYASVPGTKTNTDRARRFSAKGELTATHAPGGYLSRKQTV